MIALAVVLLTACGAAPVAHVAEPVAETEAPSPGLDLAIEFRGRRIDVGADGVLNAEGCAAARYDWEARTLTDVNGETIATAALGDDLRTISAPDGTILVTVSNDEVRAGESVLLRIEEDGTLTDAAPGASPASSPPIDAAHREPVLSLLSMVALCWETRPREIGEP